MEDLIALERIQWLKNGDDADDLKGFELDAQGCLRKKGRIFVPNVAGLRHEVMSNCHSSRYTIHPSGSKMYMDMKRLYYWEGMKRDIGEYVKKCITCQLVKCEYQKPSGLLRPLEIPLWKWDQV